MKIVAHTDDGRFLVAKDEHPQSDAVVVVGSRVSPVVAMGTVTAMGTDWIEGDGDASHQTVIEVLDRASKSLA
jgi:hypothetical protein